MTDAAMASWTDGSAGGRPCVPVAQSAIPLFRRDAPGPTDDGWVQGSGGREFRRLDPRTF